MFLATTALSQFWDKNQEILFLGSWCLRYDRRSEWNPLRYRVMPSPWDDRSRHLHATRYLEECYERMLVDLSDYLNGVHQVSFNRRYWRILVGPWLFHYLHAAYDRYMHLLEAYDKYPKWQTIVLDPQSFHVPQDTSEYIDSIREDPYNLQIFSQLFQAMGLFFPAQKLQPDWAVKKKPTLRAAGSGWVKVAVRRSLDQLEDVAQGLLSRRCEVALCDLAVSSITAWTLAWRSGLRALPLKPRGGWTQTTWNPIFDHRRNGLAALPTVNGFESVFVNSLPKNFPTLYCEGFHQAHKELLRKNPRIPSVIVSGNGWYFNEPFKFLAAEAQLKGRRLVAVQHGGGYGIYRAAPMEQHERCVSDSFLVWGWADQKKGHLQNVPSLQISSLTNRLGHRDPQKMRGVLFVATTNPRYLYRFYSSPQGTQLQEYFDWQLRFLRALPNPLRALILFRPHRHHFGHKLREWYSTEFPELRWDGNGTPFCRSLRKSRLVVVDHLSTPLLEILAANVPTVMFWDPQRWEIRDEAVPYFEELRRAGILWNSPEEAAVKVKAICHDPELWWRGQEIQQARSIFVDRYAREKKNWLDDWTKRLTEEIALQSDGCLGNRWWKRSPGI